MPFKPEFILRPKEIGSNQSSFCSILGNLSHTSIKGFRFRFGWKDWNISNPVHNKFFYIPVIGSLDVHLHHERAPCGKPSRSNTSTYMSELPKSLCNCSKLGNVSILYAMQTCHCRTLKTFTCTKPCMTLTLHYCVTQHASLREQPNRDV